MNNHELASRSESIKCFKRATNYEKLGEIGLAMEWYGKAYRLDPEVEKYVEYSQTEAQPNRKQMERRTKQNEEFTPFDINSCHTEEIRRGLEHSSSAQPLSLPDDVLLRIMKETGTIHAPNVDMIARTCRKMYLVSRSEDLWRYLAAQANARPTAMVPSLAASGCPTYRQLFLLRPRIRTDGIYISKITYFRPGFSASSMINPVHLVTYFRYLRFFGAGEKYAVWWLTSTVPPARVLDTLRNPPRSTPVDIVASGETANVFHGRWRRSAEKDNLFELFLCDPKRSKGRSMQWRMQIELPPSKSSSSVKHNVMRCLLYEAVSESEPPLVIDIGNWNRVGDYATVKWLGTWMLVYLLPPTETLRELVGSPDQVEFFTVECLGIKVDKLPFICFARALICLLKRIILEICWFIDHPEFLIMTLTCLAFVTVLLAWKYGKPLVTYGLF